jgi:Cytosol aminopeptidase family, N-terminal domain
MSVTWAIELDASPAERVRADLLVTPFFAEDRPLRGAASRIDWRLCGLLSEMLGRGAFSGAPEEVVLVPTDARLRAPRALLVGLGPRESFSPKALRRSAQLAVARAAALRAGIVALALPTEASTGLAAEKAAAAVLIGAGEALVERPFPLRLRLVVEAAALPRARIALADLVPRIEMEGVVARLAAPEVEPRPVFAATPAGGSDHLEDGGASLPPASPRGSAAPSAKLPSLP